MEIFFFSFWARVLPTLLWMIHLLYKRRSLVIFESLTNWSLLFFRQLAIYLLPTYFGAAFLLSSASRSQVLFGSSVIEFILCFILTDFFSYALHVWSHRSSLGWVFHKLHHSGLTYNLTTGFRTTFISGVVNTFAAIPLVHLGFSWSSIVTCLVLNNVIQHLVHHEMSFKNKANDFLEALGLVSPRFHAQHHVIVPTLKSCNYSCVFRFWDDLFKTRGEPIGDAHAVTYGVPGEPETYNPIWLSWDTFIDLWKYTKNMFKRPNAYDYASFLILIYLVLMLSRSLGLNKTEPTNSVWNKPESTRVLGRTHTSNGFVLADFERQSPMLFEQKQLKF